MSELLPNKDGCPVCFHPLDAATCATGDARPTPGDLTVCLYCTTFLRFDDDLRHVKLEDGEFSKLDAMERRTLVRARNLIRSRTFAPQPHRHPGPVLGCPECEHEAVHFDIEVKE